MSRQSSSKESDNEDNDRATKEDIKEAYNFITAKLKTFTNTKTIDWEMVEMLE